MFVVSVSLVVKQSRVCVHVKQARSGRIGFDLALKNVIQQTTLLEFGLAVNVSIFITHEMPFITIDNVSPLILLGGSHCNLYWVNKSTAV